MSSAAVLLAAGGSSRFDGEGNKLRAVFRGRPLVSWALEAALGAGLDEVVVVTGAVELADLLPDTVTVLDNPGWRRGLAGSLAVALEHCARRRHSAAVVGLGDQPLITASSWRAVSSSAASLAVATYGGQRRNPVCLSAELWPLLPRRGDEGARALMRRRPELVVEVPCEGDPADIDTRRDFGRFG